MIVRNKKVLKNLTIVFIITEFIFSFLLQTTSGRAEALFSFASVLLACLFFSIFFEKNKVYMFTQIALICTVFADYFLVLCSPQYRLPAMLFFLVAQTMYFLRLYKEHNNIKDKRIIIFIELFSSFFIGVVTLAVLKDEADMLSVVSMIYYVTLIINIVFSYLQFKKNYLMAFGLTLFICCDTVIGLDMLKNYLPISNDAFIYKLIYPGFNLAWVFYLPSQVMLSLSMLPQALRKINN